MRISDWSSDVCSSDLGPEADLVATEMRAAAGPLGTVTEARAAKIVPIADVTAWLAALGGRDNLAEVAAHPSRLMLPLRDDAVDDAVLATPRSDERPVGQEWCSPLQLRLSPYHKK